MAKCVKTFPEIVAVLCAAGLLSFGCSSDSGNNSSAPNSNPNAPDVDKYIGGLPDYVLAAPAVRPLKDKSPVYVVRDDAGWDLDYRFDVVNTNIVVTTDEIMSPDKNFGVLWPGNIIQGSSIATGSLKSIPLDRAPITMTISLDAPVTSIVVDTPNSVTAQQAISDLKRSVDPSLVGDHAPSAPGTVTFKVEAANSFEQSMLGMGITAGYSAPMSAPIGGSASMSVSRGYTEQTVVARLVQKLFTIRVADDLPALRTPSGFFAPTVTAADLGAQETAGNIGADNLPMYIESVTYGRIIVFTLKSTTASSVDALAAAVNASYEGFTGGAGANAEQQEILATRTTEVYQAGGNATAAQAAVANLDFSQFFTDMTATEAVPISFRLKELKAGANGNFVNIFDSTSYDSRDNGTRPTGYEVTVTLDKIVHTDGLCVGGNCPVSGNVLTTDGLIPEYVLGSWVFVGSPPQTHSFDSDNSKSLSWDEPERSAIIFPAFQPAIGGQVPTKLGHRYEYPFNEITRGETRSEKVIFNGVVLSFDVFFKMTKRPVY